MPSTLKKNTQKKNARHNYSIQLKSNAITNLSSHILSTPEEDILTKGLSFIPTLPNDNTYNLNRSFSDLIKNTHISYFFKNSSTPKPILHIKSNWVPPTPTHPQINLFTNSLLSIFNPRVLGETTTPDNITTDERQAIQSLIDNRNITIKKADKGGSIVILNTTDYINTALDHLQTNTYIEQNTDHTQYVTDELNSYLTFLRGTHKLPYKIINYITPNPPRTPLFYYLPKIHKPNNPPRPIISGCDSPTDNLSKFITKILTPIAQVQPSYLKDTKHLLQILNSLPPLPCDSILVTADVTSLYTNIPHDEGIHSILHHLDKHRDITPNFTPRNRIVHTFLHFILKYNYFDFLDKHYLQTQGTAMGTKMAPPYANLFMASIESSLTASFTNHILLWKRFIDDIFFIWHGNLDSLSKFISFANTFHPTIKFTFEQSSTTVNFLDLHIYKNKHNTLDTTIYRKPTDKHLLLHFTSNHPLHIKRNIIYNQALRYKRNISNPLQLQKELITLQHILTARGYPHRLIKQQIKKAILIPRPTLLKNKTPKQPKAKRTISYKLPYNHQRTSHIKRQIRQTWNTTITDQDLTHKIDPPTCIVTLDQNLKNIIIRTKQHKPT